MQRMPTKTIALYAMFIALTLFLGMTPYGLIPLGAINLTTLCIPVIVGTLVLGLKAGLLFGFFFGSASFLSALGLSLTPQSGLAAALLAENPFYVVLMCYIPRLLVPVVTHGVYQLLKNRKSEAVKIAPAAVLGSLTNTFLYLGLMLFFFVITGLDSSRVLAVIAGAGLLGGSGEAVLAGIIAVPTVIALKKIHK
ncbi:ECF transporter S component [Eubacteriales bacterium OttesenSCG-928-K08]|nr:ECF transporter S component [Eubacteriales bacterium OttesenSCG-928-K08]